MESIQHNPYQTPQASEAVSRFVAEPKSWAMWVCVVVGIEFAFTVGSIYVDRNNRSIDSFVLCVWLTAIAMIVYSVAIGAKYVYRDAVRLGQLVNFSVWLTMLATAIVAVPAILGGEIGKAIYPVFAGIWIVSGVVSFLLTSRAGKMFNKDQARAES